MKKIQIALMACAVLGLASCDSGPDGPTPETLLAQFSGTYCSQDGQVRLTLGADGRYNNKRLRANPFGGSSLPESCEGNFSFVEGDNSWKLVFAKSDKKSNPMLSSCSGEMEIWTEEKGFTAGDSIITLKDLFDDVPVVNNLCGG